MAVTTRTTAVGVFPTREQAQQAIAELKRAGFREDDIGVAARGVDGDELVSESGDSLAGEGAIAGAAAGAGIGALWGVGIAFGLLPAIGPAVAGGLLGTILSSTAAGAAAAGLAGALIGLGVPEDEAGFYEGEFHSGRTIVTVRAHERYDEANRILANNGSYDVSNRPQGAAGTYPTSSAQPVDDPDLPPQVRPRPR